MALSNEIFARWCKKWKAVSGRGNPSVIFVKVTVLNKMIKSKKLPLDFPNLDKTARHYSIILQKLGFLISFFYLYSCTMQLSSEWSKKVFVTFYKFAVYWVVAKQ